MKSFLSKVVADILTKKEVEIHNLIFILPSQRACIFLREEIIKQLTTATFLPNIKSIENYIQELANLKQIDTVQLLFEFYSVYKENTPKDKLDSFDTFSQWATIVLQDFNEVDRHLLESKDLFTYLRDINRLENWNPTTEITKNYFSFFEKLHLYYDTFYQFLLSKKIGYQGLIYREAENNIQHYITNNTDKHIVLVGFNALNKAEEVIFQELLQSGLASIYWDVDESYLKTSKESGAFLRKYKANWKYFHKNPFNWIENHFKSNEKNIHFISTTKNVSQLKYVGELLETKENHNNTALVLADESLLALTLNSLPNTVEKVNITMGFLLVDIPLSGLFNNIFQLYLNQDKLSVSQDNLYYHKDISNLLSHSYLKKLLVDNTLLNSSSISKSNRIFLSENHILEIFENTENTNFLKKLFKKDSATVENVLQNCLNICKGLKNVTKGVEREYVYRFFTVFQQLKTLNLKYGHITSLKTLHQFFLQLSKNEKLSFQGEPLEGLQLMGMLETRVIDFETVIITSANEGVLPASKSEKSFIPIDVKTHFNLPTFKEKDAIFSYHFYRLLHRAKNIYVLYNTEGDAYGTGEKSRFLTQLEIDRKDIKHTLVNPKVVINNPELIEINKSDLVIKRLKELAKKGFSASALSTYIYNPIDFYYQKILKIKDLNEVEETVALNTMGTVIHETLEQLYTPYVGEYLTVACFKKMFLRINDLVTSNFKNIYLNGDITKGKNKLIFEVSKKQIKRFLEQELKEIKQGKKLKILSLERNISTKINIEGLDFPVKLNGIIDRIDQLDGITRIIDYKTGIVKSNQLKVTDFSVMSDDYKFTKALQVMLYAYLYIEETNFDTSHTIEAGIISFKNLKSGLLKINLNEKKDENYSISEEKINEFLVELKRIILEIFDAKTPFRENTNKAY